jgi:hypothetical protein
MVTHHIVKKFNAIIQGMTVMACNEKEQDDVSPSAVKNARHQERIVAETKSIEGVPVRPRDDPAPQERGA